MTETPGPTPLELQLQGLKEPAELDALIVTAAETLTFLIEYRKGASAGSIMATADAIIEVQNVKRTREQRTKDRRESL